MPRSVGYTQFMRNLLLTVAFVVSAAITAACSQDSTPARVQDGHGASSGAATEPENVDASVADQTRDLACCSDGGLEVWITVDPLLMQARCARLGITCNK